jgi:hypothetical protein
MQNDDYPATQALYQGTTLVVPPECLYFGALAPAGISPCQLRDDARVTLLAGAKAQYFWNRFGTAKAMP